MRVCADRRTAVHVPAGVSTLTPGEYCAVDIPIDLPYRACVVSSNNIGGDWHLKGVIRFVLNSAVVFEMPFIFVGTSHPISSSVFDGGHYFHLSPNPVGVYQPTGFNDIGAHIQLTSDSNAWNYCNRFKVAVTAEKVSIVITSCRCLYDISGWAMALTVYSNNLAI